MSQLKKGALLSYVSIFLTNGIGLVLTPYIIRSLGDAEYGLYTLIGAFVGYMTVLDLGLNNTIIRYVAKYRAEKDKEGEEKFLGTSMLIYIAIALLVCFIGFILYLNLESIFSGSLTDDELSKAKIMFLVLLFNIAVTLPGGAFEAICSGYEHFVYPRAMKIIRYLIRSAAVVGLLYYGGDAIGLVVLDTIMNLSIILSNGYYVLKKLKVNFNFKGFDKILVKEIFGYSIWIFVIGIVYQLQWKSGQFLLGIKTDTVTVAIYAVGILLGTYYMTFSTVISNLFLPKAVKVIVNNANGEEITNEAIKLGRLLMLPLTLILSGFMLFGNTFVKLWIGESYNNSWIIALIIMITLTNSLVQSFLTSILKAKNLYRFKTLSYIFSITIGIVIGYFLINHFFELGMIIGICIGILFSQILINIFYVKELDFDLIKFYREVFMKLLLIPILIFVIMFFIVKIIVISDWLELIVYVCIYSAIYLIAVYNLSMNVFEKKLFNGFTKHLK